MITSEIRCSFFVRCTLWDWHDSDRIEILDESRQRYHVLDRWQTFLFHGADGSWTVEAFIKRTIDKAYFDNVPPDLEHILWDIVLDLVQSQKIIALSKVSLDLEYGFKLPLRDQTEEQRRKKDL